MSSMAKQHKLILIDDNKVSAYNWVILLRFIGEDVLALRKANWQARLKVRRAADFYAFMLGEPVNSGDDQEELRELLQSIHEAYPQMPLLLRCDEALLQHLPEQSRPYLLALPEPEAGYQHILATLQKARQLGGASPLKAESKLISPSGTAMFRSLVGNSKLMQDVRELIRRVAGRKITISILGESGTGKEIVARNLHYFSGRGDKAFVAVNCAAISADQFDALLYGQEAGFAGQKEVRPGLFEQADGGTLFLDKVSDLPLSVQAKLLLFLEDSHFERLGGKQRIYADVRIITASYEDLPAKLRNREFREDLYYQLSAMPIRLPALREHVEDIPELINELIARLEHKEKVSIRFNSAAQLSLQKHHWPGNVRELANLVERLAIIHTDKVIGLHDLPLEYQHLSETEARAAEHASRVTDPATDGGLTAETSEEEEAQDGTVALLDINSLNDKTLQRYLDFFEKNMLEVAMDDSADMLAFAAERLGLDEASLKQKLAKHHLNQH